MRLIIKTKSRYINFYWIKCQNNSIVGWFAQDYVRKLLAIPNENNFDSHFTFPKDGNYHFSYKSITSDKEEFINSYFDIVKIKTIVSGEREVTEYPRDEFDKTNPYISLLVPRYHLKPLAETEKYQFPVVAFSVYSGDIDAKIGERTLTEKEIEEEDLVIDVSEKDQVLINIFAYLRLINEPMTDFDKTHSVYKKETTISVGKCLEFVCIINDE